MRKIGLALLTLTIAVLAACGEAPTAPNADDTRAELNGTLAGSGNYDGENPGPVIPGTAEGGSPVVLGPGDDGEGQLTTESAAGGPGFLGSGH